MCMYEYCPCALSLTFQWAHLLKIIVRNYMAKKKTQTPGLPVLQLNNGQRIPSAEKWSINLISFFSKKKKTANDSGSPQRYFLNAKLIWIITYSIQNILPSPWGSLWTSFELRPKLFRNETKFPSGCTNKRATTTTWRKWFICNHLKSGQIVCPVKSIRSSKPLQLYGGTAHLGP